MGYTKNTVSGFSWQTILKGLSTGITLVKIMILARILSPQDFGLFSLIVISLGLTEATTQTGVNLTILQSKRSIKYFINTAWVIAIVRGLIIGIIMVFMGMAMSNYYSEPRLRVLISIAALIPIVKGFINPSIVMFHKNLEFLKESILKLSILLVEVVFAVAFSIILKDVIALVFAMLMSAAFEVFVSFILFKNKPVFEYIPSRAKAIFSNTKPLSISAALSYLNENADDFILGKIVGTYSLGLYHNAYSLGHKVNYEFAKSINHSTLPIFTKISEEKKRLKRAFFRSLLVTIIMVTLISLPLLIAPDLLVNLVLGEKWISIVPSLHWFVLAGILQSISIMFYTVFYGVKKYWSINLHLAVSVVTMVLLIAYLSQKTGIVGAAQALFISRIIAMPILIFEAIKFFKKK